MFNVIASNEINTQVALDQEPSIDYDKLCIFVSRAVNFSLL